VSRYQKLDPGKILEAAEALIREDGAHAVSIRNVAEKGGISKGGVQSNFGTVDKLIQALFEKWEGQMDALVDEMRKQACAEDDEISVFLKASRLFHTSNPERNAALMILMTQSEGRREYARNWLQKRMAPIDVTTAEGRKQRLSFLVYETMLAMKSLQIVGLNDDQWLDVFNDLDALFND